MTPPGHHSARQPASGNSLGEPSGIRVVSSSDLMKGARLLVIRHGEAAYRLQITQGGKLILTK